MKDNQQDNANQIIVQSIDHIMSDRFGRYSKYIIQGRALPDVRDGLKPVQRRIIYAMNELGLTHNSAYKKSARVVGEVIGKYHPHGDSSIYEALVRMAQEWKMNLPLIDMHGNKGSIDDDPAAAMRYTEVRLAKIASVIIGDIKKDTVSFIPNFDDSEREPTVLPSVFPNLLVNGAKGIAAGYATEMPPHNLNEVVDAIIMTVDKPDATVNDLLRVIKGPDFPTGGIIYGSKGVADAFKTGSGRIALQGRFTFEKGKDMQIMRIAEIPYGVIKQKLVRDIDEIRLSRKVDGIIEVRDESDRRGISIAIEITNSANSELIANYLMQKTELQIYYSYNNVAIANNAPVQLGLPAMISLYLTFQREIQRRRITFDLNKDKTRLEIVEGLIRVAMNIDAVIATIRGAEGSRQGVVNALIANFNFTPLQANAIADLRLYRLSHTDQALYVAEAKTLQANIAEYERLLASPSALDEFLKKLLLQLKVDFGTPRKTKIAGTDFKRIEINEDDLIQHEEVYVGVSRGGYLKRFTPKVRDSNDLANYGLLASDLPVYIAKVNTADKLLLFTNAGAYVVIPVRKIADAKWKDTGKHANDFALLSGNETIVSVIAVNDFSVNSLLFFATSQGQVKRVQLADFEVTRSGGRHTAMKLEANEKLVNVVASHGDSHILIATEHGYAVSYPESQIPIRQPKSGGVIGINLPTNTIVGGATLYSPKDTIVLISANGGIKRLRAHDIPPASRQSRGHLIAAELKGKHEVVIGVTQVTPDAILYANGTENDPAKIIVLKDLSITHTYTGYSHAVIPVNVPVSTIETTRIDKSFVVAQKSQTTAAIEEIFNKAEATIKNVNTEMLKDPNDKQDPEKNNS